MLVSFKEIIEGADKGGYAVPAFNVYNMETVMGASKAAEEAKAPVILQIYPRLVLEESGYYVASLIKAAAAKLNVPICLHLDHGPNMTAVERMISWGATGIMYDMSALPYEENIAETRKTVEYCSENSVAVEGELGHVGSVNDEGMDEFTEPEAAADYVKRTGVFALAVLVGNAHGKYKKPPKLDIARVAACRKATGVPLVLHGGSGIPDEAIKEGIASGIRKVNFATDLCYTFLDKCNETYNAPEKIIAIDNFMKPSIAALKEYCLVKIKLLGADGKA